jgi:hypothetical protein
LLYLKPVKLKAGVGWGIQLIDDARRIGEKPQTQTAVICGRLPFF